jgi:hypothetical protein
LVKVNTVPRPLTRRHSWCAPAWHFTNSNGYHCHSPHTEQAGNINSPRSSAAQYGRTMSVSNRGGKSGSLSVLIIIPS